MSKPYQTIHIRDFLRTDVDGVVDLASSRSVLRHMAEVAASRGVPRVLIDIRQTDPGMSISDAVELVADLADLGVSQETYIALLVPDEGDRLKRGLYLQALASGKGYKIRPFLEFESAAEWLSDQG